MTATCGAIAGAALTMAAESCTFLSFTGGSEWIARSVRQSTRPACLRPLLRVDPDYLTNLVRGTRRRCGRRGVVPGRTRSHQALLGVGPKLAVGRA
jgi:hypothetical protein